ncbi:hypothetical protein EMIHUDRAFT_455094 [Emiliania huxleyi CCMP1516]|uniref:Uncharacterized protein n=2 Tax=Emiliania huxleyi TaxID=2903 RepID=A0A0D3KKY4_EMIH1|nr:hypothetical protein EMIHUDRAFT_455094 [Emiliania huxleyi CCMP1516]EOD36419.1 hypothetical protein EMIHUDRAFT_455094 [Emiliania huxleyi CCMP1516]|eukprot:XP_005788848.1 hypothetical protein EMIHUDRAFT_455094 [Emiliania huxleyi CCMP1516]
MADEEQGVTEDDEKVTEDRATMTPKLRGRLLECTSCGLMPASREKRGCCHHLVAGTDGDVSEVVTWVWNSELPQFAAMPKITLGPDVDTSGTTDYKSHCTAFGMPLTPRHTARSGSLSTGHVCNQPVLLSVTIVMLQSLLVFAMLFTEFFNEVDDYSTTSAIETMFDFKWDTLPGLAQCAATVVSLLLLPSFMVVSLAHLKGVQELPYQRLLLHTAWASTHTYGCSGHPPKLLIVAWIAHLTLLVTTVLPTLIFVTAAAVATSSDQVLLLGVVSSFVMSIDEKGLDIITFMAPKTKSSIGVLVVTPDAAWVAAAKPRQAALVMFVFEFALIILIAVVPRYWEAWLLFPLGVALLGVFQFFFVPFGTGTRGYTRQIMGCCFLINLGIQIAVLWPFLTGQDDLASRIVSAALDEDY